MGFEIEYPVTRKIRWRWLGPLSFLGAFVAIVMLTVLNVALVGYETVNVFSHDYTATQNLWYHGYMPYRKPKAGSLCDSHLFNVGDRFTTNYTIFEWSIQSIDNPNAAASGFSYNGSPLTGCDIDGVFLNGDLTRYTLDVSIVMACRDRQSFGVTATTGFSISSLPGIMPQVFGAARPSNGNYEYTDPRPWVINLLVRTGTEDLARRAATALETSRGATPVIFSTFSNFANYCPASNTSSACTSERPVVIFRSTASVTPNGTLSQDNGDSILQPNSTSSTDDLSRSTQVIDSLTEGPLLNLIQTIYAAGRMDLGIDTPNNFILHKDALPKVLNQTFPVTPFNPAGSSGQTSELYAKWANPAGFQDTTGVLDKSLPLKMEGPAELQLVYLCRFQKRKSAGSLIISVLVAVLSMFSSGWGAYMLFLTMLAKKHPDSNACEGHLAEPYQSLGAKAPEKYLES